MRKLILSATLTALAVPALADDAALLLGVDRYQDLGRVSSGTDVLRTADALRDAGYKVGTVANGSARDMIRLLDGFADEAEDADRLVVAMSGRFVTDGDRTWYLAADARRPSIFELSRAISVESVMNVLAKAPGQAVLVIGRDSGDDSRIGSYLREGFGNLDIPQGVTVIYGAPSYSDNAISDAIVEPGGDITGYVRNTRRLGAIGYTPDSLVMQRDNTAPRPSVDTARASWNDAQSQNTADSYRDFLFRYPDSSYASEARRRLDEIENDPVRLDQSAEDALNLTRNQRRAIQRNLTLLEYDTRGVDGIFGPGSRRAVRNWQQANGFDQTSYMTAEQINRIDAQARRRKAEIEAEEEQTRQEQARRDRAYWDETGARGDEAGYRAYLERFPEGIYAEEATNKLAQFNGRDAARDEERALNINPVMARLIEARLDQLGFDPGRVDGRFDNNTREAIGRYQRRSNLPATGYLNQPTLGRLLADTFGR